MECTCIEYHCKIVMTHYHQCHLECVQGYIWPELVVAEKAAHPSMIDQAVWEPEHTKSRRIHLQSWFGRCSCAMLQCLSAKLKPTDGETAVRRQSNSHQQRSLQDQSYLVRPCPTEKSRWCTSTHLLVSWFRKAVVCLFVVKVISNWTIQFKVPRTSSSFP